MQTELQTVKTLIRLLLYEQTDLGLHCLPRPICPKTLDHYGNSANVAEEENHKAKEIVCLWNISQIFERFLLLLATHLSCIHRIYPQKLVIVICLFHSIKLLQICVVLIWKFTIL